MDRVALERELRDAVELAVVGEAWRAGLEGRAYSAAQGVLVRRGLRGAQVRARRVEGGVEVEVWLRSVARVERLVIGVGLY